MAVTFVDYVGNPAPPITAVTFYNFGARITPKNIVAQGLVTTNGLVNVLLTAGQRYTAILVGAALPTTLNAAFTMNPDGSMTTVQISSFESPSKNTFGYAIAQQLDWPLRRFGSNMKNIMCVAMGIAAPFAGIDAQLQWVLAGLRLDSCTGTQVDRWARNYMGLYLLRYFGELDASFIARIKSILSSERMTLAAIALVVEAWFAAVSTLPAIGALGADVTGATDVDGVTDVEPADPSAGGSGGTIDLAADVSGATDVQGATDIGSSVTSVPTIITFDIQSDPASSATVGLQPGEFCVYFQYVGYTNGPAPITPSPDLDIMVRLVKADGYQPVYADNRGGS